MFAGIRIWEYEKESDDDTPAGATIELCFGPISFGIASSRIEGLPIDDHIFTTWQFNTYRSIIG